MNTQHDEIRKVASGLRKMDKKPIAFLFLDCMSSNYTWDAKEILGISVFHTGLMLSSSQLDIVDCPWVPLFENEAYENISQSTYFLRGYEDWN